MENVISKQKIAEIRRDVPIADVVSLDAELVHRDGYLVGDSPFSAAWETLPIFLNGELNRFSCKACGESGDNIAYVMRRDGCKFVAALKYLAEFGGIDLTFKLPKKAIYASPPAHPELDFDFGGRGRVE